MAEPFPTCSDGDSSAGRASRKRWPWRLPKRLLPNFVSAVGVSGTVSNYASMAWALRG